MLAACSSESSNEGEIAISDEQKTDTLSLTKIDQPDSTNCEFVYDTISDMKYSMHLGILEKFNNKDKRGYYFASNGDTINHFLYHQDIIAFITRLDSTEEGIYKRLTNKVVFLILEQDPKMLDYGLSLGPKTENRLDYFMKHVSNPTCNSISIDTLIRRIETEMAEPNERAKEVKEILLNHLGN